MTPKVILAVEDVLSQVVAIKVLSDCGVEALQTVGLRGNGYLKTKAPELNRGALRVPVLMLTDLDSPTRCPVELVQHWVGGPRNPDFLFRVVQMEIESWLLADRDAFAEFAGVAPQRLPASPDAVPDPKQLLVNVFRKCRNRRLREDIVPALGATTAVGPGYNLRLTEFVEQRWKPAVAAERSPSLARTLASITRFAQARQRRT